MNITQYEADKEAGKYTEEEIETLDQLIEQEGEGMNREEFMTFFRRDDFHTLITPDDAHEIFMSVLHGSSDINKELIDNLLHNYDLDRVDI